MSTPLKPLGIWYIYAEAPDYLPVAAPGEGLACVDDVARIGEYYLRRWDKTRDSLALGKAQSALNFLLYMQDEDGLFYNFILPDGTINRTGITSRKSLSWWTARAFRTLAVGYSFFSRLDPHYAQQIRQAIQKTLKALKDCITPRFGQFNPLHNFQLPAWLPANATDVSSKLVMGLLEYWKATEDPTAKELISQLCQGIQYCARGDPSCFPFGGVFPSVRSLSYWHTWGDRSVQALAEAGGVFQNLSWIKTSEQIALSLYTRLLASYGPIAGFYPAPRLFPQINYAAEVMTNSFLTLYKVTQKEFYALLAGLSASWFLGNNVTGKPTYDPQTGRGYDGIDGLGKLNSHSGAESTVCALLALLDLEDLAHARRVLHYFSNHHGQGILLEAEKGQVLSGSPFLFTDTPPDGAIWSEGSALRLQPGDAVRYSFYLSETGLHRVHLVFLRPMESVPRLSLRVSSQPEVLFECGWSPDYGYVTMEPVLYFEGEAGEIYSLEISALEGQVLLDAIFIEPVLLQRTFSSPEGRDYVLLCKNTSDQFQRWYSSLLEEGEITLLNALGEPIEPQLEIKDCLVLPPFALAIVERRK